MGRRSDVAPSTLSRKECAMRIDGPDQSAVPGPLVESRSSTAGVLRGAQAVAELYLEVLRRDLVNLFPETHLEVESLPSRLNLRQSHFHVVELHDKDDNRSQAGAACHGLAIEAFGNRFRLHYPDNRQFTPLQRRLIDSVSAVLNLQYNHIFKVAGPQRLRLLSGGTEDHYVAAFVEPSA
jgi:hypothetical protein